MLYYIPRANGTRKGGTALYIKHHIPHYAMEKTIFTDIEFTSNYLTNATHQH